MLKPAILYKEALPTCFALASLDDTNKFYSEQYWSFDNGVATTNWDKHQFVSIDSSDNIVGYISVNVDRGCHYVHSLGAIRFLKDSKYDVLFAKDFKTFFLRIFYSYKYNKMNFNICVGSPYEAMYDRFCEKYGGRIIGTRKQHWRLQDGTICDFKLYELPRYEFIKHTKKYMGKQGEKK